jgi:hypothetical protein
MRFVFISLYANNVCTIGLLRFVPQPFYSHQTACLCYSLDRPAKSALTVIAARVPSSIAPSIKLRHPNAQSEHAKTMLRSLALISFKCVDIKPGAGKNLHLEITLAIGSTRKKKKRRKRDFGAYQAPFANSSLDQLWKTSLSIFMGAKPSNAALVCSTFSSGWK